MQYLPTHFNVKFLNLGYSPRPFGIQSTSEECIQENEDIRKIMDELIEPSDATRSHCYLYEKTLSICPRYPHFDKFRVCEVGCGLGGGIEWIPRAHPEIYRIIGIDRIAIETSSGLLMKGDAEDLPLEDESQDMVVNVESSHLYKNEKAFFMEVHRVLKDGGYLCWADLRFPNDMSTTLTIAHEAGFKLLSYENITNEVLNGIEYTSRNYDRLLKKAPWFVRIFGESIRTTYCAPGTPTYSRFARREKIYSAACWQRKSPSTEKKGRD
uniref:Methyltransf_11 domain-containing protein n=1 Tax=Panagrellus redivivus TaxID=6233 RepID=A0A7E4UYE8_PANRE